MHRSSNWFSLQSSHRGQASRSVEAVSYYYITMITTFNGRFFKRNARLLGNCDTRVAVWKPRFLQFILGKFIWHNKESIETVQDKPYCFILYYRSTLKELYMCFVISLRCWFPWGLSYSWEVGQIFLWFIIVIMTFIIMPCNICQLS